MPKPLAKGHGDSVVHFQQPCVRPAPALQFPASEAAGTAWAISCMLMASSTSVCHVHCAACSFLRGAHGPASLAASGDCSHFTQLAYCKVLQSILAMRQTCASSAISASSSHLSVLASMSATTLSNSWLSSVMSA